MTINLILNSAVSGLAANQAAVVVTSQNIANANTEGYSRQSVQFQQRVTGSTPNGVEIADVDRFVNVFLTRELRAATGDGGSVAARNEIFEQVTALFGAPGGDAALSNDLTRFAAALDRLSVSPEDAALRFDVVATGETLARNTRQVAVDIQALRTEVDRQIAAAVDAINLKLVAVFDLNRRIAQAKSSGQTAPDLEDQRDLAVLAIAERIGISTFVRDNGEITIFTDGGHALVDVQLGQITYDASSVVGAATTFGEMRAVPVDSRTLAPLGDGEVLVSSGQSATITSDIGSGRIHGLLAMRDTELRNLADQIEVFAANLSDTVNAVHNDGTAFPAVNALAGTAAVAAGDAFAATGTVRIAVLDGSGAVVGTPLDLDLTALGATTVNGVALAISAALGANGSASVVAGRLVIQAANAAHGIAINEGDSLVAASGRGFSHHFGLNDFFVGSSADAIAVRAEIIANPGRVATADLDTTATTGEVAATVGDNRVIIRLAEVFESAVALGAVGGLPAAHVTLGTFASTVVGLAATRAAAAGDGVDQQAVLVDNLRFRLGAETGVNVDEELSNLILFQNAYQASARVMTTAQEMFDTLIDMVR
ncbi:MAG: flagellar hook-associated protein FlgK [Alphaproteobacteria bacterium]